MLFLRFDHFRVADGFVCFYFFLVVPCTFVISLVYGYICAAACNTLCVSKKTLNTLWCSNGGRAIFEFVFPPHMSVHNYVLRDHRSLFCVCWVLVYPPAPIRIHPNPPESLLTLDTYAHIYIFCREISRSYMAGNHTLLTHFCLSLCCLPVC